MKYYIMTGSQCQKNGGWTEANLSCEAQGPKEARSIFDAVFGKPDSYQIRMETMVESEIKNLMGGLEPE